MQKPSIEPRSVRPRDAARMAGVSRSRIYELLKSGEILAKKDGSRTLVIVASIDAWRDRLKSWRESVGPLLPSEDRALAKERAGEPDFAGVFADHLQRLTSSLGEREAWPRALANTVRAYRSYHDCDFKTAKGAVLALIEPPAEQQQIAIEQASEPEPTSPLPPADQQLIAVESELAAVYAERLKLIVGNVGPDEARWRRPARVVARRLQDAVARATPGQSRRKPRPSGHGQAPQPSKGAFDVKH